eukprot:7390977-Prymnesium_polylepis.3
MTVARLRGVDLPEESASRDIQSSPPYSRGMPSGQTMRNISAMLRVVPQSVPQAPAHGPNAIAGGCQAMPPDELRELPSNETGGYDESKDDRPERSQKQAALVRAKARRRYDDIDPEVSRKLQQAEPLGILVEALRGVHVEDTCNRCDALVEADGELDFIPQARPSPDLL